MTDQPYHPEDFNKLFGRTRLGGILLHPTSLPGKFGIGDLGMNTYRFIDFLKKSGQQIWQILPLGPTGYGNSPYQSFSTFAGNPFLISPERLKEWDLLTAEDIEPKNEFPKDRIDFGEIIEFKCPLLEKAFQNFSKFSSNTPLKKKYGDLIQKHKFWLQDYAIFMAIKGTHKLKPWYEWEDPLKLREKEAIMNWEKENEKSVAFHKFVQFIFFNQWNSVLDYAHKNDIKIFGDIPIFVAHDSADVWANSDLFYLDEEKDLLYVAGVPPDKFSETGQRWGNPLYNWEEMKKNNYAWWVNRIKHAFHMVDFLRIDHFRGFEAYWRIPANEPTAVEGKWCPGPGNDLFITLREELGVMPIIAEDLGVITDKVEELLEKTSYPGMRVLQFAFEEDEETKKGEKKNEKEDQKKNGKKSHPSENKYLPHNFIPNTVAYTGTHDNDTTLGWFNSLPKTTQNQVIKYANSNKTEIIGDLIRLIWSSVARIALIPLQDLLRLGNEARMNHPGTSKDNWEWRFEWKQVKEKHGKEISILSDLYGRRSEK